MEVFDAAAEMRVGPSEPVCKELVSNHLKLHRSRAVVVSVEEKAGLDLVRCESMRRAKANHCMKRRNFRDDVKTGGCSFFREESGRDLLTAQAASGVQVA